MGPPNPLPIRTDYRMAAVGRRADRTLHRIDDVLEETLSNESKTRPLGRKTVEWVNYFNNNWLQEGLPQDWYNLRAQNKQKVGFMMNRELNMLDDPYNKDHLKEWVQRVRRNLEGFKLEFLTDKVVYPREYTWNGKRLEDKLYGKTKDGQNHVDIAETISDKERGGSVLRSVQRAKEFLKDAPVGAMSLITSPMGDTGLTSDEGELLKYGDSYVFVLVNEGNGKVMNYTLKTDLSLKACREALFQFSGIRLPEDAPIDWYVHAVANILPGEHKKIKTVNDVIDVLASIQPSHAFHEKCTGQTTTWDEMKQQVAQGEKLYKFDQDTKEVIDEFENFGSQGIYSKALLRKGIAAAILQMGQIFDMELAVAKMEKAMKEGSWYDVSRLQKLTAKSFGDILKQTAARPGCAGGGQAVIIQTMGGNRIVLRGAAMLKQGEDGVGRLEFSCGKGHSNTRKPGEIRNTCSYPGCTEALC